MQQRRHPYPGGAWPWRTIVVLQLLGSQLTTATDGRDDAALDIGTASSFGTAFIDAASPDSRGSNNDDGGAKITSEYGDDDGDKPDTKPWDYGSDRRDDPTNYTLMKNDPDAGLGAGRDRRSHTCTSFEANPRQPPIDSNGGNRNCLETRKPQAVCPCTCLRGGASFFGGVFLGGRWGGDTYRLFSRASKPRGSRQCSEANPTLALWHIYIRAGADIINSAWGTSGRKTCKLFKYISDSAGNRAFVCSGSLIGANQFVTAAHCTWNGCNGGLTGQHYVACGYGPASSWEGYGRDGQGHHHFGVARITSCRSCKDWKCFLAPECPELSVDASASG